MIHAHVWNTNEQPIITVGILNMDAQRITPTYENELLYHQILQTLACCITCCVIQEICDQNVKSKIQSKAGTHSLKEKPNFLNIIRPLPKHRKSQTIDG